MRYEPTEELTQLLHHFDTRYQEEKLPFTKEDITPPLRLLVNSISKLAIKGFSISKNNIYGEDFSGLETIICKIRTHQDINYPIHLRIIDLYNFIERRFDGKPLSFSLEEIFAINTIYALEHKQRQFYVENFNDKFQILDEPSKTKYIEMFSQLTNIHLNDLEQRFYKLRQEGAPYRQQKYEELRQSMQLAVSNKRLRDKEIRKLEKKRKHEQKSLESNDSNQSNTNNNSTLFTSKKAKTTDSSKNNDYLYNGDDETIASHEHESKEPPSSPKK